MKNRRQFLKHLGIASTTGIMSKQLVLPKLEDSIDELNEKFAKLSVQELADEEPYWERIRQAYKTSNTLLNFNNGGVSPHPLVVEEAMIRYHQYSNEIPSFNMWRRLDLQREPLREQLAQLAGCNTEEIAIQRNASEALETIIFGLPLQKGDEVILCKQDYPNMMNAWRQREKRDGIVLKWLDFEFPIEDEKAIVNRYRDAITKKTKIFHVTHIINWMGQIMPAKKLASLAHRNGIELILDGAHSFAHIDFSLQDLDCDYFGTSLHKWLGAPFGTGMLFVKKDKIEKVYPLLAAPHSQVENIRKFENLGTRSFAIEQAINQAIQFHNKIGIQKKEARLFHLSRYWTSAVKKLPAVSIGTSSKRKYACAISLLQIDHLKPHTVAARLHKEHQIHAVAIDIQNVRGVRITPNVYTLKKDLDQLIEAISLISKT